MILFVCVTNKRILHFFNTFLNSFFIFQQGFSEDSLFSNFKLPVRSYKFKFSFTLLIFVTDWSRRDDGKVKKKIKQKYKKSNKSFVELRNCDPFRNLLPPTLFSLEISGKSGHWTLSLYTRSPTRSHRRPPPGFGLGFLPQFGLLAFIRWSSLKNVGILHKCQMHRKYGFMDRWSRK